MVTLLLKKCKSFRFDNDWGKAWAVKNFICVIKPRNHIDAFYFHFIATLFPAKNMRAFLMLPRFFLSFSYLRSLSFFSAFSIIDFYSIYSYKYEWFIK